MIDIFTIVRKVFVQEFFRMNAGFFLLILVLTFGFMSGADHRALAEIFVSHSEFSLIPLTIWTAYLIKVINFNLQRLAFPENKFIFEMRLVDIRRRFLPAFAGVSLQLTPVLLYAGFLVITALQTQQYNAIALILIYISALSVAGTIIFLNRLTHAHTHVRITALKKFLDYRFTKQLPQFFLGWVLRREPLLCLGTKVFSCTLLFVVSQLYVAESYDLRLMAMASTVAFAANMTIIAEFHRFENSHFLLLRNLPLTIGRRLTTLIFVITLASLPELSVLLKFFPSHLSIVDYLYLSSFGLSVLILFYSLIFLRLHRENFSRAIFALVMMWLFLILCKVPVVLLTVANGTCAIIIYKRRFYLFEQETLER